MGQWLRGLVGLKIDWSFGNVGIEGKYLGGGWKKVRRSVPKNEESEAVGRMAGEMDWRGSK